MFALVRSVMAGTAKMPPAMASPLHTTADAAALVAELAAVQNRSPKLVRSSVYAAPADPSISVRSWKMNEFKYYDIPSPFPTYARGLFTVDDRIVARGYDKFFNIGEVPWTEWSFLESNTRSPYILSLKSNGCIIFIGALTPSKLVITSKHSLGPVAGQQQAHAQVGETWVKHYLEQKGRTEADLARQLWDNNWTAIAELCDDSFEEHVLSYPPDKTGLYLHGINTCTKEFCTLPPDAVDAFADEWGFIKTVYITLDTIPQVRAFTDEIRKTGTWQGEALEGFVIRTHITEPPISSSRSDKATLGMLPYSPGSTFFFKVKFDEPYLMYRDWREVTKSLLTMQAKSSSMNPNNLPKSKMRRPETKLYVHWAIKEIKANPKAFAQYQNNKGIIKTREMFLEWLASNEGKKAVVEPKIEEEKPKVQPLFTKTIIVPIAIPGSGKTAVSVALSHIFGFGHTQSDDVHACKKPGPVFIRNVMGLLETHDVVIADKNNHLRQHRITLREESANLSLSPKTKKRKTAAEPDSESKNKEMDAPRVRLLALYWDASSEPPSTIFNICAERVRTRGANHQTLRADPTAPPPGAKPSSSSVVYEDVIWKFIRESEELLSSEVDGIIEMPMGESLDQAVRRAVTGVVKELGLTMPSEEKIKRGIEAVMTYRVEEKAKKPDVVGAGKSKKNGRGKETFRYFGFLPEIDIEEVLNPLFASSEGDADFWNHLKKKQRVAVKPHVTIAHRKEFPESKRLWERCEQLVDEEPRSEFQLHMTHVVWDGRVMALVVESVTPAPRGGKEEAVAQKFVSHLEEEVRERFHVTVGTREAAISPVEAKTLVKGWKRGEENKELKFLSLGPNGVTVKARMSGLF